MTSNLCAECTALLPALKNSHRQLGALSDNEDLSLKTSHNFFAGADAHCHLCLTILSALSEEEKLHIRGGKNRNPDQVYHDPHFSTMDGRQESEECVLELTIKVSSLKYITKSWTLVPWRTLDPLQSFDATSTASKKTVQFIKDCLQNCDSNHLTCKAISMQLPTRLIFVGSTQKPTIRLCENFAKDIVYATLSHCWGKFVPIKLLQSNISSFKEGFLFSELSKTFKEAIHLVRRLKIPFIWIDSLCIIQDSTEDWLKESSLMYQVYSNALLNIAATASDDGQGGLFNERHPLREQNLILPISWRNDKTHRGPHIAIDTKMWVAADEASPLLNRGWVCQERMLSRRNLHFGKEQVFFECRHHVLCELLPIELSSKLSPENLETKKLIMISKRDKTSQNLTLPMQIEALNTWHKIVHIYTRGRLTYGSDKLLAISALARHWNSYFQCEVEYYAGLWSIQFPFQLLWHANPIGRFPPTRQKKYTAPTWSWASNDGIIEQIDIRKLGNLESYGSNDITSLRPLVTIDGIRVDLVSEDRFGLLKDGCLTVSGNLASGKIGHGNRIVTLDLASTVQKLPFVTGVGFPDTPLEKDGDNFYEKSNVLILPIMESKYDFGEGPEEYWIYLVWTILLEKVSDVQGTFQRIGMCEFSSTRKFSLEQACLYFDQHADKSGLEYKRDEEVNVYKIIII